MQVDHPLSNLEQNEFVRTHNTPVHNPINSHNYHTRHFHNYLKNVIWKKREIRFDGFYTLGFTLLWNIIMALFAACITFWIPAYTLWGINITAMVFNVVGSMIYAFVTTLQQVRYQYFQTYIMYDAISGGFCSVLTTFGNFIVDTDILLGMQNGFYKALINWTGTLFFSFLFYQLGRLCALKWKAGVNFTFDLLTMENEDRRIHHEIEKEEMRRIHDEENDILLSNNEMDYGSQLLRDNNEDVEAFAKLEKLEHFMTEQMDKKRRHVTKRMKPRHIIIIILLASVIIANCIIVGSLQYISQDSKYSNIFVFDFAISLIWCVLGSLAGRYIRLMGKPDRKGKVQWSTFKVNMISCIIIGTAHNILLLRNYIFGNSLYYTIIFQRLINNFCGSESNFSGFIDDCCVLWNSKGGRMVAIRNFFYNLVLCTVVFLMVVLSVRLAFFYDVRIFM